MTASNEEKEDVVHLSKISKTFGFTIALKNISLTVEKGETIGLIGNNGAGKSTLLKIIALLVSPSSGNMEIKQLAVRGRKAEIKQDMEVLLSHAFLFDDLTGRENLEYYFTMSKRVKNPKQTVKEIVKQFNLKLFIDRPVREYSTGMAKKLEILRVSFPTLPDILLLDEPFSGLDVENREMLHNIIVDRPPNKTVIICSHDFDAIAKLCSRVYYLEKGKIIQSYQPSEYNQFLSLKKEYN
ncbi:MAG: ABC transporter ATP-binding protein [Candidatus Hodarchaeales archaeon]